LELADAISLLNKRGILKSWDITNKYIHRNITIFKRR